MLKHILFIEKPPSMTADSYRMVPFFCRHSVEECTVQRSQTIIIFFEASFVKSTTTTTLSR